ncbi:MAG TPA: hypothetical protein VJN18_15050 [Polyangiaceae bacterium]|nr:hypothetical protein [Polyangiaceae bacterium]
MPTQPKEEARQHGDGEVTRREVAILTRHSGHDDEPQRHCDTSARDSHPLISGYTFEESLPVTEGARSTAYLSKPFDTKTLSTKVHALLHACSSASVPPGD